MQDMGNVEQLMTWAANIFISINFCLFFEKVKQYIFKFLLFKNI